MADENPSSSVSVGSLGNMEDCRVESLQEDASPATCPANREDTERKARVDAVWLQMSKGVSAKNLKSVNKSPQKTTPQKSSNGWMNYLGLASKKTPSPIQLVAEKSPSISEKGMSEDAKRLAAAALSSVKDAAAAGAGAVRGKVEITEVRDFVGQDIEVKKLVDAAEAADKGKGAATTSAVDVFLEQIKKKPKLSVLDKTKKDWGEFKEDNKGMEDELDAYKKSSNQYLDKVSFLQRADYREFERERDARLALQSKRKTDMREDL